jgi:pimeloyl-ACP methyl ester carboxylesterase
VADIQHHEITLNNLKFHYVQAGPATGPLVLLLHGFPEFWYGWHDQIPALAAAGFRVIAPDQRGYNLSAKPREVSAYDVGVLAGDVLALIDQLGEQKIILVGHDWGAAVAWWFAIHYPERLHKLAIMNVPHPSVMSRHLRGDIRQFFKSWYMFFFQIPWLPEFLLGLNKSNGLAQMLRGSGKQGTFSDADIAEYRAAWQQPGALTGMINWYRAIFRRATQRMPKKPITLPVLVIWGEQDIALRKEMAEESLAYCENARLELIPEATHWVQHDAAEKVNRLLLDFFQK